MSAPRPLAYALLGGYLLGSIPLGLLITRAAGAPDVRTIGSGNIGATNVLRTGRKGLAALTLVCDALKGTIAVLLAGHFGGHEAALAAGLGAFLGHLFPVWLKFKGGKGVATYIGLLIGLAWRPRYIYRDLARRRLYRTLLVAIRVDCQRVDADRPAWFGRAGRCCIVFSTDNHSLDNASRQYRPPA